MAWYKGVKMQYYHIHSLTSANETSSDPKEGLSNNYVSDVKGGCFTKPYYYYTYNVHHDGYSYQGECGGTYETRSGHRPNDPDAVEDVCSGCGATAGARTMAGQTCHNIVTKHVPPSDETVNGSGWSWHDGVYKTTYYCNCGYKQGDEV